ncbi:hypothetical protein C0Q70_00810 [Pomacea canaliculata]|uniref:Uncharacterized protein n=1 Tax=Pomacea canaliculata TaxID=400727 RepID=A0A2T7PXR4_POMCA|nr:hypothetical protein C0Q70_00810 [Pomacea canaliculata]
MMMMMMVVVVMEAAKQRVSEENKGHVKMFSEITGQPAPPRPLECSKKSQVNTKAGYNMAKNIVSTKSSDNGVLWTCLLEAQRE